MPSYEDYLESHHWQTLSYKTKLERGNRCERCNLSSIWAVYIFGHGLNVHHKTYQRIGHERPSDLLVLCMGCHANEHGLPQPEIAMGRITILHGWAAVFDRFKMPDVVPFRLPCLVCHRDIGPNMYNGDELDIEWICRECRG